MVDMRMPLSLAGICFSVTCLRVAVEVTGLTAVEPRAEGDSPVVTGNGLNTLTYQAVRQWSI